MAQVPEIPASAYTPKMETLGVIPDIPVFEGDQIPMSHNALTFSTRPLQFLLAPGSDFSVRYCEYSNFEAQKASFPSRGGSRYRWRRQRLQSPRNTHF
ncbi:hypothetical protein JCGZ_19792 [Jatropha curcas]|uniref:Uncharacterized protein n=1 Tax=Jatropha curcas TaxID=180498 RepID=A0A067K6Y7_JATCU|nr:hypothetical protein JCGZ_19792 [Jatropha curcas]